MTPLLLNVLIVIVPVNLILMFARDVGHHGKEGNIMKSLIKHFKNWNFAFRILGIFIIFTAFDTRLKWLLAVGVLI